MIIYILAYLGGVITIISPCILPVLPFVFARADRPFLSNGLPMLVGMAVMFMLIASLAAVGGSWAVSANQYGRWAALALLAFFGLTLLIPSLADRMTRPLVALGARLSEQTGPGRSGVGSSLLLGVATGLLWAPCAGPILGLILTGAALQGANAGTTLLLLAYALGAATSLALALLVGGRVYKAMTKSLHAGEWIKRALGVLVLIAVGAIALGADTGFLARASLTSTNRIEQVLMDSLGMPSVAKSGDKSLKDEGPMPPLDGAAAWINSPPLTREQLKGKVVLIDFWTYSCINCIRTVPYVRAWADRYRDDGFVVIGVHSPEFAFEKDLDNVRKAVRDFKIDYPVAVDNDRTIWRAFDNRYWPAHYFIDARGRIRYFHFGEGGYAESERVIQRLLAEASPDRKFDGAVAVTVDGQGVEEAASGDDDARSPETYIGFGRTKGTVSKPLQRGNRSMAYTAAPRVFNEWGIDGQWTVTQQYARSDKPGARILYRFRARDVHLVLGPSADRKPVRFRLTIDGKAPGAAHGLDSDAAGNGVVTEQRLYQLIRFPRSDGKDHDFTIEFLDPGIEAFSFTFG